LMSLALAERGVMFGDRDLYVLPVAGFASAHKGFPKISQTVDHPEARVNHKFAGSWFREMAHERLRMPLDSMWLPDRNVE